MTPAGGAASCTCDYALMRVWGLSPQRDARAEPCPPEAKKLVDSFWQSVLVGLVMNKTSKIFFSSILLSCRL